MLKFLDKFLELKNEAEGTKKFALFALIIITISLAMLSICGAWAKSEAHGDLLAQALAFIPRVFYSFLVLGLELFAAVLFVRALVAAHWIQSAICIGMLGFLAWANVQNAKDGVHFIFQTRFAETGQTLRARAELAGTRGNEDLTERPKELERIRGQIAELKVESDLMRSQTRIREAQERLVELGYYPANRVDGVRAEITLTAMAKRGEEIRNKLALLEAEESTIKGAPVAPPPQNNEPGAASLPPAPKDQRDAKIEFEAAAREADSAATRLEIILWVAEIARSLGLWAAVTAVSGRNVNRGRAREEELAEALHQAALRKANGDGVAPSPEPKPADPPPMPISEPVGVPEPLAAQEEVLDLTTPAAPIPGRPGGMASGHMKNAAKAKAANVILVGDWEDRDAEANAAKVAAQ